MVERFSLVPVALLLLVLSTSVAAGEEEPILDFTAAADANNSSVEGGLAEGVSSPEGTGSGSPASSGEQRPVSASQAPVCELDPVEDSWARSNPTMVDPDVRYAWRRCDDGSERLVALRDGETAEEAEPIDVRGLAQEVLTSLRPPVPEVVTSPPLGAEVVTGMPMYLAVDEGAFASFSDQVELGGATLTVQLDPVETVFDPGDGGAARTCAGRGSVWQPGERPDGSECSHVYTHRPQDVGRETASFALLAHVTYEASFSVTGTLEDGGELGALDGPVAAVDIPVVERRAVRVERG